MSLNKIIKEFYSEIFEDVYAQQSTEKNEEFREYVNDEVFAGKLYTAENAKRVGLIDGIGSLDYAKSRIISLLNNY